MRYNILIFATVLVLTAGCCAAAEETRDITVTSSQEWTWEPEGYNTFDGMIDLSGFIGMEITLTVNTDLAYSRGEEDSQPVFTELNGKRIKMNKQKSYVTLTPDEETSLTTFSGRITLPKRNPVRKVNFQFTATDADGKDLKTWSFIFGSVTEDSSNSFRIPVDITFVTICAAAAAALVWACVMIRNRKWKRNIKMNTGE